jgi:tetratricopeptide (TPR) repeat protein
MSEDQFNSISDRVYQLERSDLSRNIQNRARFIIQFFLLLIVILGLGYYFYQHLDSEIQKVATKHALHLSKLTDSKLSAKIAAQIVDQIENNEQVRTSIKKIVADDFQRAILETPLTEETVEKPETTLPQISEQTSESDKPAIETGDALKPVTEQVTDDSLKKEQPVQELTKDFKTASKFEAQGFTYLLAGEFDNAITAFNKAEISFPSYHQVYEISRLLRKEKANLDNPEKRRQIYLKIVNEMSYGAPPEMLDQLKELASEDGISIKTDEK